MPSWRCAASPSCRGSGSIADGVAQVAKLLDTAGLPRTAWDFSDGSGMSSYNRVSPRGSVKLLRWAAAQPWGAQFRDTLPIGGVDGTLARRFKEHAAGGQGLRQDGHAQRHQRAGGLFHRRERQDLHLRLLRQRRAAGCERDEIYGRCAEPGRRGELTILPLSASGRGYRVTCSSLPSPRPASARAARSRSRSSRCRCRRSLRGAGGR